MKKSFYNHLTLVDNEWVLYNSFSDEVAVLAPELKAMYEECTDGRVRELYPEFHDFLRSKRFYVPDDETEYRKCIEHWDEEDNDPTQFTLTVNPTLDCNMRCWYCYENHQKQRTMPAEIAGKIYRFIEKKMASEELKTFSLSFFGGEPLLQYRKIVQPLVEYTCRLGLEKGKEVSLGFTTNGYLLSEKNIDFLSSHNVPLNFQITLDGNEKLHDRTRHTAGGKGSYAKILENCRLLLKRPNVSVTLRCNYTRVNAASFMDLPYDLELNGIQPSENLHVDFHRVWQDSGADEEVDMYIREVQKALTSKGYSTADMDACEKYRCYAERNNHLVVNYDGGLFHCTARDFTPESAEGVINEDGTLTFNERNGKRAKTKWGNATCFQCRIYPLCQGLCSQQKYERFCETGCIAGRTEEVKTAMLEKRTRYLVEKSKKLLVNKQLFNH